METNEELKELIEKSGNTFHYKVVNFLRNIHWSVLVSPYYNDNITDKPREIDIIAEKAFEVYEFNQLIGTVNVKLFIECKYINSNTVFWFDDKDKINALKRVVTDTGLDPIRDADLSKHHYIKNNEVAKLFVSQKDKDKSQENDVVYKAINQGLNSLVYYKNSDSIITNRNKNIKIQKTLSYPVIMCNNFDTFYKVKTVEGQQANPEKIDEPFQFEINYAYKDREKENKTEYFLVDIVNFSKFEDFIKNIIDSDVSILRSHIAFSHTVKGGY